MFIRNTSRYPTPEVRQLVKFATSEIDMRRVCVNVKNRRRGTASGMAYEDVPWMSNAPPSAEYLVTVRLGPVASFPNHAYADWCEALVYVAAHEAIHIEQFREDLRRSEVRANGYARQRLDEYRKRTAPEGAVRELSTTT